jgi:CheY-like chemotaxis protein
MPEVLLIDDNETQLRAREAVLSGAGMSVVSASTADLALALLRDPAVVGSLKVIVTDHMMPVSGGTAFVHVLLNISPSIPVIVISGMAEAREEYAGMNVDFLYKPCPPEELIACVRSALNRCK